MDTKLKWVLTDPDQKQYGTKIDDNHFAFRYNDDEPTHILLKHYSDNKIEDCINSFGYTIYDIENGFENVYQLYGDDAKWIIAECLFELEY